MKGVSVNEIELIQKQKIIVKIDKNYFRPNEIDKLKGDITDAKKRLDWTTKIKFKELIKEMVLQDIENLK